MNTEEGKYVNRDQPEQFPEDAENPETQPDILDELGHDPERSLGRDGREPDPENPSSELEERKRETSLSREDVEHLVHDTVHHTVQEIAVVAHSSGPIPDPGTLAQYSEATQERILRMAESSTTDESARRDKVVQSVVEEARKNTTLQYILLIGSLAIVGYSVVVQAPWYSSGIAALIPIVQAVTGNLPTRSGKKKKK